MRVRSAALAAFLISAILLAPALALAADPAGDDASPVVDVVEVSGMIDSPMSEYIADEIRASNRNRSELLVISISSPGGLNVRTESLLRLIDASAVPVAVYVGPQRAKAAGTAAMLVAGAHIAAIGPSARLGPAHPTNLAVDPDSERGKALQAATREQIDRLAAARGRDPGIYTDRSIPASEALDRRQVDFNVVSVAELLQRANGRTVALASGEKTLSLEKDEVTIRFHKPGPWRRVLHTLVIPSLVYVLLVTGVLLVVFELFQPGFGVAGVTGALLLVGAVYGLFALPTALWAVAAFIAGCALLSFDVAADGLGVPTWAGLAGFVAGSAGMFSGPARELQLQWWMWVMGAIAAFIFFVPVMTIVRRARQPVKRHADPAMVGLPGQVRSMLNPEGYVWVADGLWRARSDDESRIRVGENITVTAIEGSVLRVRVAGGDA